MNEADLKLLKKAIEQVALGLLYHEHAKDLKNMRLIEPLAYGKFDEFESRIAEEER